MELKTYWGEVIFSLKGAKTILEVVKAALDAKKSLSGAVLRDADLSGSDLRGAVLRDADLSGSDLRGSDLRGSDLSGSDLRGAVLRDADLSGAVLRGKKVQAFRVFSGLYRYEIMAVLFQDGSRMVRMGCLWKTLEEWEHVGGIRKSNLYEFPDDGSEKCEERVRAFNFAKDAVLRLK